MSVVARFRVNWVQSFGTSAKVNLTPVYTADSNDPHYDEIKSFFEATPSGLLEMQIRNEMAAEQFQPGDEFYLSLQKVTRDAPA